RGRRRGDLCRLLAAFTGCPPAGRLVLNLKFLPAAGTTKNDHGAPFLIPTKGRPRQQTESIRSAWEPSKLLKLYPEGKKPQRHVLATRSPPVGLRPEGLRPRPRLAERTSDAA